MSSIFNKLPDFFAANAPAILTTMGAAGVVSTAVMAVRATPDALRDIWDAESERTEPLSKMEKVQLSYQKYLPAVAMGTVSIAAIVGAQSINTRRMAALMSLYTVTENSRQAYQKQVIEKYGEEAHDELKAAEAQQNVLMNSPMVTSEVLISGNGEYLVQDGFSGRVFRSDYNSVMRAVNELNQRILWDNHASLNDFYKYLGIETTKVGDEIGWDEMLEINIQSTMTVDNQPCLYIDYMATPRHGYYKVYK